jgi:hypothetical protein
LCAGVIKREDIAIFIGDPVSKRLLFDIIPAEVKLNG